MEINLRGRRLGVVLALLIALLIGTRLRTYNVPHESDICFYAVVGHGLLHGQQLYTDLWDHKPPAPYMIFAAAELLFGYGSLQILMLGTIAASLGMLGVFAATRQFTDDLAASFCAAAFWIVLSSSLCLESVEPNCELFTNALLVWALYLVLRAGKQTSRKLFYAVGFLIAAATLFKPIFIVHGAFFAWVHWRSAKTEDRSSAAEDVLHSIEIGMATWLTVLGYFALTGRLGIFFDTIVTYNLYYSADSLSSIVNATAYLTGDVKHVFFVRFLPVGALILVAYILGTRALDERSTRIFTVYLLATYVAVAMPGKFFPHYFQLWLPPLSIATGWAVARLRDCKVRVPGGAVALALMAFTGLVVSEAPSYLLSPSELSQWNYDTHDVDAYQTANRLSRLLLPQECFIQIGGSPGVYFAAGRTSPTAALFSIHLRGPLGNRLTHRMIDDIHRATPQLIAVDKSEWPFWKRGQLHPELAATILSEYSESPTLSSEGPFAILVRKGGSLEARLHKDELANRRAP